MTGAVTCGEMTAAVGQKTRYVDDKLGGGGVSR